jgi:hypothetical protein
VELFKPRRQFRYLRARQFSNGSFDFLHVHIRSLAHKSREQQYAAERLS